MLHVTLCPNMKYSIYIILFLCFLLLLYNTFYSPKKLIEVNNRAYYIKKMWALVFLEHLLQNNRGFRFAVLNSKLGINAAGFRDSKTVIFHRSNNDYSLLFFWKLQWIKKKTKCCISQIQSLNGKQTIFDVKLPIKENSH